MAIIIGRFESSLNELQLQLASFAAGVALLAAGGPSGVPTRVVGLRRGPGRKSRDKRKRAVRVCLEYRSVRTDWLGDGLDSRNSIETQVNDLGFPPFRRTSHFPSASKAKLDTSFWSSLL